MNLPKKHSHLNKSMHGQRSSTDATSIQYDEITFDYNSVTEVCLLCVSLPNTLSYYVLVVMADPETQRGGGLLCFGYYVSLPKYEQLY